MALGMQYDFDRLERAFMRDRGLPVAIERRWVCLSSMPRERVTLRDLLREPYTTRFTKRPLT